MIEEDAFGRALRALKRGEMPRSEDLGALSHLDGEQLRAFEQVWGGLPTTERARLLAQLYDSEREQLRQSFSPIYTLGFGDADPGIRRQALRSTGEEMSPRLLGAIVRLAREDADSEVREAAAAALGPYALEAELGELSTEDGELVFQTLLAILERPDEEVGPRREALAALGYLERPHLAEQIRRALEDPDLHLAAIRAMGRTGNPEWRDTLAHEAASPDPTVRLEAARACGELGDLRAVSIAADLVDDRVLDVRLAAIRSLGEIGGDEARDALLYALEDQRVAIREAASQALASVELADDPLAL